MNRLVDIEHITDLLIRPPRFTYSLIDLGSNLFLIQQIITKRYDFQVKNRQGQVLQCSLYYQGNLECIKICMIYLHCNCGSRIQAKTLLQPSLIAGYALLTFDFAGCGHSTGQYISLGYHEVFDLKAVISQLKSTIHEDMEIILWGRSMGAVTALRYVAENPKLIKLAVVDSPFLSLKNLIVELVNQKIGLPKFLIEIFLKYIQPHIEQKAKFKITQLDLTESMTKIVCPLIFIASKMDDLVPYSHIEQLYQKHKGRKIIYYLQQGHNQPRRHELIQKVFKSVWKYLIEPSNRISTNTIQIRDPLKLIDINKKRSLSKKKISLTVTDRKSSSKMLRNKFIQTNQKIKSFLSSQLSKTIKYQFKQTRTIKSYLKNNIEN